MELDTRPVFNFEFNKPSPQGLRYRLLQEANETLAINGKPQRGLRDDVDGLLRNRGTSDSTLYQILRIIKTYLKLYPIGFMELVQALETRQGDTAALDRALEFIPGVQPPKRVWDTLEVLQREKAEPTLIQAFWAEILDAIEGGEEDYWVYVGIAVKYRYEIRGLPPGYWMRKSKDLVPWRDRPRVITVA